MVRAKFHVNQRLSVSSIFVLLVGLGPEVSVIPRGFRLALEEAGIGVEPMNTPAACRTYNVLLGEGRRIAAAVSHRSAETQLREARYLAGIGELSLALQHEINNPLASLLMQTALLRTGTVEAVEVQFASICVAMNALV